MFQGYLQYNIYADLFLGIISENKEELQILGIEDDDRGIYLCRKGVVTMVAAGSIVPLFPLPNCQHMYYSRLGDGLG